MFATKNHSNEARTQLQQSLDRDAARTQSQEVGLDAPSAFVPDADPTAPIFGRSNARPKSTKVDLFSAWRQA